MARHGHANKRRQRRSGRRPRSRNSSGEDQNAPEESPPVDRDGQVSIEMPSPEESKSEESEPSPRSSLDEIPERTRSRSRSPVTTIINRPRLVSNSPRALVNSQVLGGHDVPPFRRLSNAFSLHQQQPIIVVEPQTDDSLMCDCRYCQFLSGWCCMPSFLFLMIAAIIIWMCLRGPSTDEQVSAKLFEGLSESTPARVIFNVSREYFD